MRILYVQFTNPAGYPPLLHSSRILAGLGWEVQFLGIGSRGTDPLRLPAHPLVREQRFRFCPAGWKQKLHYARFCLWALWCTFRWRPDWIYASDPLACPVALLLGRLSRVPLLYHEHDSPLEGTSPWFVLKARRRLARIAQVCVLPNEKRSSRFKASTGSSRCVLSVWNCPLLQEASHKSRGTGEFVLHYHGNIGPDLLPLTLLDALSHVPGTRLEVVGYATQGQEGYRDAFAAEANRLGLSERVSLIPAMAREALLDRTRRAAMGVALMPMKSPNPNFASMVGASNKPFEYLACGLPVLVSDLEEWRSAFVAPGYGMACDPRDSDSIARALRWGTEHRTAACLMGELGRQRVQSEWNYEHQFEPVLRILGAVSPGRYLLELRGCAGRQRSTPAQSGICQP